MKFKITFLFVLFLFLINTNSFSQDFGCNAKVDASGEYIDLGNNAGYYGTSLTVEARINADSWKLNIHEGTVLSCGTWNGGESGWDLRAANNGNLSFNFSNGSGWNETMTTTNPMLINQWYHVAATFDNGVVKVYIDGAEVATQTYASNIAASTTDLYIGTCPAATDRNFNGYIDEVRIWDVTLDAATLLTWYNQELTAAHPSYANIVAYYPFTNQSIADASGNGNDGSMIGTIDIANCSATCADITNIIVDNIAASTADITWTLGDAEANWNIIISETVVTDFASETPIAVTTNSYPATGLSSATTYYIYVQADCGSGDEASWVSSDFTTLISCPAPTGFLAGNITSTTADISWTAGDIETAWNIIVSETPITDFSGETPIPVATNSYNATGLSTATEYFVYIQADCTGDESSWLGGSFFTSCETMASFPWLEEFEDWGAVTNCWDLTGGTQEVSQYNSNSVRANYWSWNTGSTAYLSSLDFDITSLSTPGIEFYWSHSYNATYPTDSLALQVTDDAGTTWTTVWSKSGTDLNSDDGAGDTSPGTYISSGVIDLSAFGDNIAFRFYFHSGYGPDCFIDNVSIFDNSCAYPTALTVENITSSTADISWTAGDSESAWNILISETEITDFASETPTAVATNSYSATSLTPDTDYFVYVQADCGGETSNWIDATFTTQVSCPIPTDILIENITSSSADISWTAGSTETAWNILISETVITDFASETPTVLAAASYSATGLTPDTDYYVYIQADCGATDGTSLWIDGTFTTQVSCPVPTAIIIENLTETTADISWTAGASETDWNILISETVITDFAAETPIAVVTNTYPATGLTAETTYYVYVQADCGATDGTSTWAESSFYTGYCIPNPSSTDGDGITNVTFGQVLIVNNETTSDGGYADYSDQIGDGAASLNLNVDITFSTGYGYTTGIFVDWNNDLDFDDADELVYTGESSSDNPTTLNASFIIPAATPLGEYRMRIFGSDYSAPDACYTGTYGVLEDYTLSVSSAPDCLPVTDILIENISSNSADISWTPGDSETDWSILVSETEITDFSGETPIAVTAPNYAASTLTPETTYYVYVQADCGATDGTSIWISSTFTTAISCPVITGITIENITSNTADISWTIGGSETDWNIIVSDVEITDFSGETPIALTANSYQAIGLSQETYYYVYIQADCGVTDGTSQWISSNFTTTISCPAITGLILEDVTMTSANILWTAGASEAAWNVVISETEVTDFASETPIAVTTNSYEATGLDIGTSYYVYVQADCGGTDGTSNWIGPIVISDQSGRTCFYSNGTTGSNSFNGSYFDIPTNNSFDLVKSVTIEAWVKTSNATQNQKIIGKTDSGGGSFTSGYMLGIENGRVYPEVWDQDGGHYDMTDNPELYDTENGTINSNKWTHIAFTFEGGEKFNGYINGHLIYSIDVPDVLIGTNDFNLILGAAPWDVNFFGLNGYVDDIRIWRDPIDSLTINQWMHKQVSSDHPFYASLVANYIFESHSETHSIDISSNSNNGIGTRINWEDALYPYASYSDTYLNNVEGVWDTYSTNYSTILSIDDVDIIAENGIAFGDNNLAQMFAPEGSLDVDYKLDLQWRFENILDNTFDVNIDFENINIAPFDSLCIITASDSDFTQDIEYFTLVVAGDIASYIDFNMTSDETFVAIGAYTDEILDVTPPVITEVVDENVCISVASEWTAPSTTASDDTDGNITAQIVVTYSINDGVSFDATLEECRTYLETAGNEVIVAYNVTDAAGNNAIEETSTFTADVCDSKLDIAQGIDFNVYPNPNNGSFKLEFGLETASDIELEINNMLGQTIFKQSIKNTDYFVKDFDLDNLNSGTYIISVRFDNGVLNKRLIVR